MNSLSSTSLSIPDLCRIINFPSGNSARLLEVTAHPEPKAILESLQLPPINALIMLSSGANDLDKNLHPRLIQLFNRGIARTAAAIGAGFISGGTDCGAMALLGQSIAERGYQVPLVGVVPTHCVTRPDKVASTDAQNLMLLEPHHSHFVSVDASEWGGETAVMYDLAAVLAKRIPVITLLINGGMGARAEILRSVRLGLTVIIIEGSGRLADELAALYRNPPEFIEDAALAEIIADGHIHLFPLTGTVSDLERLIYRLYRQLRGDTTLRSAWRQFGLYDLNARTQQRAFQRTQTAILGLGVVGTTLALIQASIESLINQFDKLLIQFNPAGLLHQALTTIERTGLLTTLEWTVSFLTYAIMAVPIAVATLLAAANRFNAGTKWILLRASAEQVKQEIYRYRAQAEIYSPSQTATQTRETKLAEKLQGIGHHLMQTEVNLLALQDYRGPIPPQYSTASDDNGLDTLTPEHYLSARLEDQLFYYVGKTKRLDNRLKLLQWAIYIIGGVGTLLAAVGLELWIALTTALVTALGTYIGYQQLESTLLKYNQAATALFNVRTWWLALSEAEQAKQENIDLLVGQTERILQTEFSGWMQQMQEAFNTLKEQQAKGSEQRPQLEKS